MTERVKTKFFRLVDYLNDTADEAIQRQSYKPKPAGIKESVFASAYTKQHLADDLKKLLLNDATITEIEELLRPHSRRKVHPSSFYFRSGINIGDVLEPDFDFPPLMKHQVVITSVIKRLYDVDASDPQEAKKMAIKQWRDRWRKAQNGDKSPTNVAERIIAEANAGDKPNRNVSDDTLRLTADAIKRAVKVICPRKTDWHLYEPDIGDAVALANMLKEMNLEESVLQAIMIATGIALAYPVIPGTTEL